MDTQDPRLAPLPQRDGERYAYDDPHDAQLFVGRLATAVRSVDELARLHTNINGATVRVQVQAPAADPPPRTVRGDALLARRIDGVSRLSWCRLVRIHRHHTAVRRRPPRG